MSITSELQKTLATIAEERTGDCDLARLQAFYAEMKKLGLVVKKEYDLPPLDTIGRTGHQR